MNFKKSKKCKQAMTNNPPPRKWCAHNIWFGFGHGSGGFSTDDIWCIDILASVLWCKQGCLL